MSFKNLTFMFALRVVSVKNDPTQFVLGPMIALYGFKMFWTLRYPNSTIVGLKLRNYYRRLLTRMTMCN